MFPLSNWKDVTTFFYNCFQDRSGGSFYTVAPIWGQSLCIHHIEQDEWAIPLLLIRFRVGFELTLNKERRRSLTGWHDDYDRGTPGDTCLTGRISSGFRVSPVRGNNATPHANPLGLRTHFSGEVLAMAIRCNNTLRPYIIKSLVQLYTW